MRPLVHIPWWMAVLLGFAALNAVYQITRFRRDSARQRVVTGMAVVNAASLTAYLTVWRSFLLLVLATFALCVQVFVPPWPSPSEREHRR